MRIEVFQHEPFEGPAAIGAWAAERGHTLHTTHWYDGAPPPLLDAFDALVIMGGAMSVHDVAMLPWLVPEKQSVRAAIDAGKAVFGVCLGAQLIADVLGADVTRSEHKEIGWFPVVLTDTGAAHPLTADLPRRFDAFHWHGETFAIPDGATHLASSAACANQAFAWGRSVVGLQFHLESTHPTAAALCDACADELTPAPYIQSADTILAEPTRFAAANAFVRTLLDRWAG